VLAKSYLTGKKRSEGDLKVIPKIDVASKVLHKQSSCKELQQPEIMHRIATIGNHPKSPVS
jgi:hypothetical protein